MWTLKYGAKEQWFQQLAAEGHRIKALEERPDLYPDLVLDFQVFATLSASRGSGMGVTPIPLSEILAYMQMFDINDYEERRMLLNRILLLDRIYLNFHRDK